MRRALQVIFVIGVAGLAFSGVLSYQELFGGAAACGAAATGGTGKILGVPTCVYGFVMYALITTVAAVGLLRDAGESPTA